MRAGLLCFVGLAGAIYGRVEKKIGLQLFVRFVIRTSEAWTAP